MKNQSKPYGWIVNIHDETSNILYDEQAIIKYISDNTYDDNLNDDIWIYEVYPSDYIAKFIPKLIKLK